VDTFICTDPALSACVLEELDDQGFGGRMICLASETTMDENTRP
jgi:hypothetical protein